MSKNQPHLPGQGKDALSQVFTFVYMLITVVVAAVTGHTGGGCASPD